MPDYYQILQIPSGSSINDVKKAYRKLAHIYHPDVSILTDAREKFIEINEAYEYLLNKIELEENLKKWNETDSYETSQSIIDAWIAAERARIRERARRHSQMKYSNFKKTEIYRTTEILNNTLVIFTLIFRNFCIFRFCFWNLVRNQTNPLHFNFGYLFSAFLILPLVLLMTGYSLYKIMDSFWPKKF